jgi:hypothetical protein
MQEMVTLNRKKQKRLMVVNVKRKCTHCDGTKATRLSQYSSVV